MLFANLVDFSTLNVDNENGMRSRAVLVHVCDADLAITVTALHGFVNLSGILHHV